MNNFYEHEGDLPEKFIAIYSDGSGCEIFYKINNGWQTAENKFEEPIDKYWFIDAGYLWFIPLPDDFKVWSEE